MVEDLQCLANFQALGISVSLSGVLDFHNLSQTVGVPVRWLELKDINESCLCFTSRSFFGNPQLQGLVSLSICRSRNVQCVKFGTETETESNMTKSNCQLERLETLDFFHMDNLEQVIWNYKSLDPKDVFPRLQFLEFHWCSRLTNISWVVNLPCILHLVVVRCRGMKQLICIDEVTSGGGGGGIQRYNYSFPFLKVLFLEYNTALERISDPIITITFPALERLRVSNCELKKLPFKADNLPRNLKKIEGQEEWWKNVELEDGTDTASLQGFFEKVN